MTDFLYTDAVLVNGDFPDYSVHHTDPLLALAQRIITSLQTHRGEWFADLDFGLPFKTWKAQKPPDTVSIRVLVRKALMAIPGVQSVTDMAVTWDRDLRAIDITATVMAAQGTLGLTWAPLTEPPNVAPTLLVL